MKFWLPKINYYSKRLSTWHEKLWEDLTGKPFMGIIDNVAGVRFYKEAYGTVGAKQHLFGMQPGVGPQGATKYDMTAVSVFPYGTVAAAGIVSGLTTQIDRGSGVYDTYQTGTSSSADCLIYGYNIFGEAFHGSVGSFGSIDTDNYSDGGGTTRTIKGVYHSDNQAGCNDTDTFFFSLDGTSISNSDTTWADIDWDDVAGTPQNIDRSVDITTYTASLNGSTHWEWASVGAPDWTDTDLNTDFVLTTA